MDMFFEIYDRNAKESLKVNVTQIRTYSVQDQTNKDKSITYLIVYGLTGNRYIEEEFTDVSTRDAKLKELAQMAL